MPKNNRKVRKSRYKDREPLDKYARDIFGSLSRSEVEIIQDQRRMGFSYRKIQKMTRHGIGTIYKYAHVITQETVLDPHGSIEDNLVSLGVLSPRPPPPVSPPPPVAQTQTIFEGTLEVAVGRPAPVPLEVPSNSQSASVSVTAKGSPFVIQILSPPPPQVLPPPRGLAS